MSAPILVPGLAVAAGRTRLLGFDPVSGKVLWSDIERVAGPLVPPAIDPDAGLLVFTEGDRPGKGAVVAVDVTTREERWRFSIEDISRGGPTIADGAVFVGSRNRFVYAVDEKNGTLRWKKRLEAGVKVAPAAAGGSVYVVSENGTNGHARLYSLDASTGKTRWSYSPRGVAIGASSPTVANGTVFVGLGGTPQVRAFDAAKGTLRWSKPVRSSFWYHSSLAFSNGDLFALDVGGGVYRLAGETGDLRWDFQFPSYVSWSSPLVVGRTVYLGMDDGTVAGIDVASGHMVWRTRLGTGPISALVPAGDLLLASSISRRGALVAFRRDPSGVLLDVHSPTELHLPVALLNFAGSFVLVLALLLVLFRFLIRPRDRAEFADAQPLGDGPIAPDGNG
jgi:outer membrane protein assembly factor BamB